MERSVATPASDEQPAELTEETGTAEPRAALADRPSRVAGEPAQLAFIETGETPASERSLAGLRRPSASDSTGRQMVSGTGVEPSGEAEMGSSTEEPLGVEPKRGSRPDDQPNAQKEEGLPDKRASGTDPIHIGVLDADTADYRQHSLLRYTGTLCGRPARILIDSGASHNIVAANWMHRHNLTGRNAQVEREVKFGNGETGKVAQVLANGKLRLNRSYGERLDLSVAHLDIDYDVILGKPWLYARNPTIDWRTDRLTFDYMGRTVTLTAIPRPSGQVLLNTMEAEELIDNGAKWFSMGRPQGGGRSHQAN